MRRQGWALWMGCLMLTAAPVPASGAEAYAEAYERGKALEDKDPRGAVKAYGEALGQKGPVHIHLRIAGLWLKLGQGGKALREVDLFRRAEPSPSEQATKKAQAIETEAKAKVALVAEAKAGLGQPPRLRPRPAAAPTKDGPAQPKGEGPVAAPTKDGPAQPQAVASELVRIEAGSFQMGSPKTEEGRSDDEDRHAVTLTRPFLLGRTEVTQGLYQAVMGENPSGNKASPLHPVENVSWFDAVRYCNQRSKKEGLPACYVIEGTGDKQNVTWPDGLKCRGYRLPTEAEWEYAARAGQHTLYSGSDKVDEVAWNGAETQAKKKRANAWGLYNMSGNVWEWVWDFYAPYQPGTDPIGPAAGSERVLRGGSWLSRAANWRVSYRSRSEPADRYDVIGFRLSRSL